MSWGSSTPRSRAVRAAWAASYASRTGRDARSWRSPSPRPICAALRPVEVEARVVDDGQHAVGAQAGLDAVDQQQGAVLQGQGPGPVVEFRRHCHARITFAHHGFEEHRLDELAPRLGPGEDLFPEQLAGRRVEAEGHVVGIDASVRRLLAFFGNDVAARGPLV